MGFRLKLPVSGSAWCGGSDNGIGRRYRVRKVDCNVGNESGELGVGPQE